MSIYAFHMHKMASSPRPRPLEHPGRGSRTPRSPRPHLSATHAVRPACPSDALEIHDLVTQYAAERLLLPRSLDEIEQDLHAYVVVVDANDRVKACAALYEYSPSLAEIGSVAVAREAQGIGLGSLAVRGAEAIARRRGIAELFAMTLTEQFFESLGYSPTAVARYPEKLARYAQLRARGVEVVPRTCLAKVTGWA